jgi:hypothetical protein
MIHRCYSAQSFLAIVNSTIFYSAQPFYDFLSHS